MVKRRSHKSLAIWNIGHEFTQGQFKRRSSSIVDVDFAIFPLNRDIKLLPVKFYLLSVIF